MQHHMRTKHPECKGTQHPLTAPSFSSVSSAPSTLSPVPLVENALQPKPLKRSYATAVTPGLALPSVLQTSVSYNDEILKLSCEAGAWFYCGKKGTRRVTASDDMEPDEMGMPDLVNLIAHDEYADLVSIQKSYDDDIVRKKSYDEQNGINALASLATVEQIMVPQGIIASDLSGISLFI